jgi:superfamily II DNA or RNA helicase/SAM-dependent methyltransferase/SOS-response transcriptional repressor LexA
MNDVLAYYDRNAKEYIDATFLISMSPLYEKFLQEIPEGGHILDAGCGSGRDALHFHRKGYRVTAFDGSEAIASLAEKKTGLPIIHRTFADVSEHKLYDGIWACASLLHLREPDIRDALSRLWAALKPGGSLYMSFRHGDGETLQSGRYFFYANEDIASRWIADIPDLKECRFWTEGGQGPDREEAWLNILITREHVEHQRLSTGGDAQHFLPKLCQAIKASDEIDLAVAFVKRTGLSLLMPDLVDALVRSRPARIRIVTSDYLDITDPEALREMILLQEHGAQIRLFESQGESFHMKAYIFSGASNERGGWGRAFIGSSNISRQALKGGLEWNYQIDYPPDAGYWEALSRFEEIFSHPKTVTLTDSRIDEYASRRRPPQAVEAGSTEQDPPPEPHKVQVEALDALNGTRTAGYRRGLVVLATGLGKTWLAAFDAAQVGARRILFVAHREEILHQAAETFLRIKPNSRVGYYMGKQRDTQVDVLCASVQTLGKEAHLDRFSPQHFDYIVVDEFHHAAAPTYHRLLGYFSPQFMLGLTATPDRTDRSDILSLCDDNVVYEYRLFEAVQNQFLVPFHYYGIYDESVSYDEIPWRSGQFDPSLLANKLATMARARHVLREWSKHRQNRTLAFCVSIKHADFMAQYFRQNGIAASAVHGQSELSRGEALERLNSGELSVIFSVDLFSEGVDLPAIDTVLLLRPTESKILFLQQIGRGLRKSFSTDKEKLIILDFVGNHQSFLHKPQALMGKAMNHRQLADFARDAERGQLDLPDGCFVNYDLRIIGFLKSLDQKGSEKDYHALRETLGRRPTLTEYYRFGANLSQTRQQHGSWFGLLHDVGDLDDTEEALIAKHGVFLKEVEITAMVRSLKIILLQAFQFLDGWQAPPSFSKLAEASWAMLQRRPNLVGEISAELRDAAGIGQAWLQYCKRNLVDHWASKHPSFFRVESDLFLPAFSLQLHEKPVFENLVQELIDYRLASYESRIDTRGEKNGADNVVPLISLGTELPYFPSLKIACGHFRSSQAEVGEYRSLGSVYGSLDPARHFIAVASGNSMNGGKVPIQDGDYLLLEQISPESAGSNTGQTLAIERIDEVGGTQYLLRKIYKNQAGEYVLKAANPDYEDIVVTPQLSEQFRTFARLKSIVSPLDMMIGQEVMREDIPPLFGEEFNPGNWQSGHVVLRDAKAHVLLVTLNKQGRIEDHRYIDHWVDDHTFHWQTQRKTTPDSKRGREIIEHQALGLSVHLFVRENKLRGGKASPFVYHGPVEYLRHDGSAPMSVRFRLVS